MNRNVNILLWSNKFPAQLIQFGGQEMINIEMKIKQTSYVNTDQLILNYDNTEQVMIINITIKNKFYVVKLH